MEGPQAIPTSDEELPNPQGLGGGWVSHAETCLFWRCARYVLEGHPASVNVVVYVPGRTGGQYPLLIMTLTKADRLVCWPVLPDRVCAPEEQDKLRLTDHVTLELGSKRRRSHSTEFDPLGGKHHHAHKWKICSFEQNGVSLWFGFAVRLSVVENQVLERHQWIRMPLRHKEKRVDEFRRFLERLTFVDAKIPKKYREQGDSMIALVYIEDAQEVKLSEDLLHPLNQWPDEFWDKRPEDGALPFVWTKFTVSSVQLALLLGFPPSNLREEGPIIFTPRQRRT